MKNKKRPLPEGFQRTGGFVCVHQVPVPLFPHFLIIFLRFIPVFCTSPPGSGIERLLLSEGGPNTCGFPLFDVEGSPECFLGSGAAAQLHLLMADTLGLDPN